VDARPKAGHDDVSRRPIHRVMAGLGPAIHDLCLRFDTTCARNGATR
jgi:hypothetical protein